MNRIALTACLLTSLAGNGLTESPIKLFDGTNLDRWEFQPDGWVIDDQGALTCRMEETKQKNGKLRTRGKGYIWTKKSFENFELVLEYKLSEGANSGVFFRTDPANPVQGGFEVQLLDNAGFQKVKGKKDRKNLNGAFYDCQAASKDMANRVGQWNRLKLTCQGPKARLEINGQAVNEINYDRWETPQRNPDGSANKFKTALKELPRVGRIGFQNHGQVVWFRNVTIEALP